MILAKESKAVTKDGEGVVRDWAKQEIELLQGHVEIYGWGTGLGSADGTLLRGNIRVGGFWLNQHDRIFTKDRLTKVVDNEFD